MKIETITPAIGAEVSGIDFKTALSTDLTDALYSALLEHLVLTFRDTGIAPAAHLAFAQAFGQLDEPHPHYPHVTDFENIVLLENDETRPADTNSWHTDLTFKAEQPFASVLVAREVPDCGGDTLWSSRYAAYDRLPAGLRRDLEDLEAIHDLGDFRNSFVQPAGNRDRSEALGEAVHRFGHQLRPLIARHPVTGRKYLNFNEAFVTHIAGLTTNEANSLKTYLANHMNKPEFQMRWRWRAGDLVMWDNRVTMHYAVADYLPAHRVMNRVTIVRDSRDEGLRRTA